MLLGGRPKRIAVARFVARFDPSQGLVVQSLAETELQPIAPVDQDSCNRFLIQPIVEEVSSHTRKRPNLTLVSLPV